ncbi:MAG: signal peptide peptidase SppA [Candidatus Diapherotrites archaeon]|nr:signal peptide peptidase SppA [Candidatus Diapherotrites archaeon]
MRVRKTRRNWVLFALVIVLLFILLFTGFFLAALLGMDFEGGKVGVVPIKGPIVSETSENVWGTQVGARDIIKLIEAADNDESVSVILLDINSGGGSIVASKEIMRAVKRAKKPVVAYIGDAGASGAYYIASAADIIVADEDSITGSIGVLAMIPNYKELMQKIGLNMTILKEGKNKVMGNPYEEMTPEQRQIFQNILKQAYEEFKSTVIENRRGKITEEAFDSIADGRILNGRQAKECGLIDYTGSRDLALRKAAGLGNIEGRPKEKLFEKKISPLSSILGEAGYAFGKGMLNAIQQDVVVRA